MRVIVEVSGLLLQTPSNFRGRHYKASFQCLLRKQGEEYKCAGSSITFPHNYSTSPIRPRDWLIAGRIWPSGSAGHTWPALHGMQLARRRRRFVSGPATGILKNVMYESEDFFSSF